MTWRRYLQIKTREPAFLWRMSLGILVIGVVVGLAVDWAVPAWIHADAESNVPSRGSDAWSDLERLAAQSQWAAVWWGLPRAMIAQFVRAPGLTALALLTGASWLAFALQAVQIRSWRDQRLWAPLVALALGVLSVWPTLFFILWQEHGWGLVEGDSLAAGLRYNILGIGLREEVAKLMCFALLLPWLVWRGDELAALVSAGCVGIGFGMEENVGYISGTMATATLGRLLTATPAHMALTGLLGLAAYRACRWPRAWGPQFVATFGTIVIAHGMYDAFLQVPALKDYTIAAGTIFVLLVYQFFRELRPLQRRRSEPVSLTANFLACASLVAAATFIYLCAAIGWRPAGNVMAQGVLAQGVMIYLFLREMPESLVGA